MAARLVECVPNFSEGRRPEVVRALADAIRAVPGALLLDESADASHNRCVITFVATPEAALEAAFRATAAAAELIDLTRHQGEHPRIGATDVIPFVPLAGTSMDECVALARRLGALIAERLGIPVYLYERAATRPDRRNLADIRRGEFEGLAHEISRPERHPDFGPPRLHPTAGATVVGARNPLVAYNVNLATADVAVAKAIARAVRESSGGLPAVRALGFMLEDKGCAQVSMNLVDHRTTGVHEAFAAVRREAAARGVEVAESELIGLAPLEALLAVAAHHLRLPELVPRQVIEARVLELLLEQGERGE